MKFKIAVILGDGIGPEITPIALAIAKKVSDKYSIDIEFNIVEAGDNAYRKYGEALPKETLEVIRKSHATLKGPVGETAADVIVKLRQMLNLYANIRPAKSYPNVPALRRDIDLVIVRENTECLYKGFEYEVASGIAIAIRVITYRASRRIAEYAFNLAMKRRRKVVAVHKANVLRVTCGLFAKACRDVALNHPEVTYEEQYVDACAANLVRRPHEFDVIVTTNMFGDILSDLAAQITGSLGLAPAANIGDDYAIFEPVHGAAFDIAGKGSANPIAMILSTSMMFKWLGEKYNCEKCIMASENIERAIESVLAKGKVLTPDLGGNAQTKDLARAIESQL